MTKWNWLHLSVLLHVPPLAQPTRAGLEFASLQAVAKKNTLWVNLSPVSRVINGITQNLFDHLKRKKPSNFLKPESGSEKAQVDVQIANLLHEKCTWLSKKLHGKSKLQVEAQWFANIGNNIAIHMWQCIGFWTSKCTKPAQLSCEWLVALVTTPWKMNGWNLKITVFIVEKEGHLPNLHFKVPY